MYVRSKHVSTTLRAWDGVALMIGLVWYGMGLGGDCVRAMGMGGSGGVHKTCYQALSLTYRLYVTRGCVVAWGL